MKVEGRPLLAAAVGTRGIAYEAEGVCVSTLLQLRVEGREN